MTELPQDAFMTGPDFALRRLALGLTQQSLAYLLGMTPRALQDIEGGRAKVRPVHRLALDMVSLREAHRKNDWTLLPKELLDVVFTVAKQYAEDAIAGQSEGIDGGTF